MMVGVHLFNGSILNDMDRAINRNSALAPEDTKHVTKSNVKNLGARANSRSLAHFSFHR